MSLQPKGPPCKNFKPQLWRQNVCMTCFHPKEKHKSAVEEQFSKHGFDELSKDDPTEVFELIEMVGTGAYGSVFKGRDVSTDEIYAIKFLELEKTKGNDIQVIVNEINIMKQSIECPYIVEYKGVYCKDDVIMMVMEYCVCSVEDILAYCDDKKFTENQIAAVCASLVKALAYLHHSGISHRDIKSGNVLLKETGEVKLADFGVSHKLQHERDKMKTLAGSPYWCAPELITADSYDNKVDIWACGIVALEMAEGRPPYWDMEPLQVIFHIPKVPAPKLANNKSWSPDFNDFIDKCLRKEPSERLTAYDLLCHPFILSGSSKQILIPLVQECLPVLLPKKKEELQQEEAEQQEDDPNTFVRKGTIVSVDKRTYKADVLTGESLKRDGSKNSVTSTTSNTPTSTTTTSTSTSSAASATPPRVKTSTPGSGSGSQKQLNKVQQAQPEKQVHRASSPNIKSGRPPPPPPSKPPSFANRNSTPTAQPAATTTPSTSSSTTSTTTTDMSKSAPNPPSPSEYTPLSPVAPLHSSAPSAPVNGNKKPLYFGVPLEISMHYETKIMDMTDHIISHLASHALDTENLFRVPGDEEKVNEIKQKYDSGEAVNLSLYGVHEIANVLKLYLKELPEPLLTFSRYDQFLEIQQITKESVRMAKLKTFVSSLPVDNKRLLHKLVVFFAVLATHSKRNKLDTATLANCMGSCLLYSKQELTGPSPLREAKLICSGIQKLIEKHRDLF